MRNVLESFITRWVLPRFSLFMIVVFARLIARYIAITSNPWVLHSLRTR